MQPASTTHRCSEAGNDQENQPHIRPTSAVGEPPGIPSASGAKTSRFTSLISSCIEQGPAQSESLCLEQDRVEHMQTVRGRGRLHIVFIVPTSCGIAGSTLASARIGFARRHLARTAPTVRTVFADPMRMNKARVLKEARGSPDSVDGLCPIGSRSTELRNASDPCRYECSAFL